MKRILSLAFLAAFCLSISAADLYVSLSTGNNKNDGKTPATALKNIFKALDVCEAGDVIHVAEGNYHGKMNCGGLEMKKPVSLICGYSPDFAERSPMRFPTMLRPTNKMVPTVPAQGMLKIDLPNIPADSTIVIDGMIFDQTDANSYHGTEGKPEGFSEGMLTLPPAKGTKPNVSLAKDMLYAKTNGTLVIQNCLFLNGSNKNASLLIGHKSGQVKVLNNVFIGNRMLSCGVSTTNGQPYQVEFEFAYNTVLFTWTRTKALDTMGYGLRSEAGVIANIHNNIIGLNTIAGWDNTKGDPSKKKITLDNNIFFLNKADGQVTMNNTPMGFNVADDSFDSLADMDGMESVEGNQSLSDPSLFANILDPVYLNAFLSLTVSETTDYDPSSPENQFRAALGINTVGKISTKVSMFANPYPYDSAVKFFGAVPGFGAQEIK